MDVDSFIAKYRPEWERLDRASASGPRGIAKLPGPEIQEVIRLYLRASAHLAEVQSRYADSRLTAYLNGVVARAHGALYGAQPRTLKGGARAFGARYREAVRRTAPFILIAAALLVVVTVATTVWIATSAGARAGLLPPFVQEAIRRGGGGRATIGVPPASLSTFILVNNVQVAFLAFGAGITLGIGTIYLVIQNATLLGVLAGAYTAAGRTGAFWALILPHGMLELTAICLAAGAGLRMGWSLIDPGDRPRGQALAEESGDAVVVVIGVIPAFGVAAVIEGFLTGSSVPDAVELAVGSLVAVAYVLFLTGGRVLQRRGQSRPSALMRA